MKNWIVGMIMILTLGITACEPDGPAEEFGEKVDRAAEDAGDAARDVGNAIEDACEDATDENC